MRALVMNKADNTANANPGKKKAEVRKIFFTPLCGHPIAEGEIPLESL